MTNRTWIILMKYKDEVCNKDDSSQSTCVIYLQVILMYKVNTWLIMKKILNDYILCGIIIKYILKCRQIEIYILIQK